MEMKWNAAAHAAKRRKLMEAGLTFDEDDDAVTADAADQAPARGTKSDSDDVSGSVRDLSGTSTAELSLDTSLRLQEDGSTLAEAGKYGMALGKWESAIRLTPERAVLHELQAQVHLEMGATWQSLKAATRATQLDPMWPEAWITLSRAQVNYGEPGFAAESASKAARLQPDNAEAMAEVQRAHTLVAQQRQKAAEANSSGSGYLANGLLGASVITPSSTRRAVVRDRIQTHDRVESKERGCPIDEVVVGSLSTLLYEDVEGKNEHIKTKNCLNGKGSIGAVVVADVLHNT